MVWSSAYRTIILNSYYSGMLALAVVSLRHLQSSKQAPSGRPSHSITKTNQLRRVQDNIYFTTEKIILLPTFSCPPSETIQSTLPLQKKTDRPDWIAKFCEDPTFEKKLPTKPAGQTMKASKDLWIQTLRESTQLTELQEISAAVSTNNFGKYWQYPESREARGDNLRLATLLHGIDDAGQSIPFVCEQMDIFHPGKVVASKTEINVISEAILESGVDPDAFVTRGGSPESVLALALCRHVGFQTHGKFMKYLKRIAPAKQNLDARIPKLSKVPGYERILLSFDREIAMDSDDLKSVSASALVEALADFPGDISLASRGKKISNGGVDFSIGNLNEIQMVERLLRLLSVLAVAPAEQGIDVYMSDSYSISHIQGKRLVTRIAKFLCRARYFRTKMVVRLRRSCLAFL